MHAWLLFTLPKNIIRPLAVSLHRDRTDDMRRIAQPCLIDLPGEGAFRVGGGRGAVIPQDIPLTRGAVVNQMLPDKPIRSRGQ